MLDEEATVPPPAEVDLHRQRTTGDSIDLCYDQKEHFVRGWTRDAKQSRSVKLKKRTDYQVDKRRQQSLRDKGLLLDDEGDDGHFDDF